MLPKSHRLTKTRDFALLGTKGRSVFGPFVTMRVRETADISPKVAFITSTKVFKRSVDRNRVKRRLRAIVYKLWPEIPKQIHLLFIVKPEALKAANQDLINEITRLLVKIPEALKQPPKLSPGAIKRLKKREN